jgi:Fic family protein
MTGKRPVENTPYCYDAAFDGLLSDIGKKVEDLRSAGTLTPAVLKRIRDYFRLKNIYNSNAIEGNLLSYNETRLVVEQGLTISGKPLKDTLEAKNLSDALNLFEELADRQAGPIVEADIRSLHQAVLKGVNDREAGKYRDVEVAITGSDHRPPGPESVAPEMQRFGEWLKSVTQSGQTASQSPILVACAAHTWFVSIHPFIDGNGRVSRLLLNLILMRFGFPIAVITKEDRQRYYEALGESDHSRDLSSLLTLVVESVEESLEQYQAAAKEQREEQDWAQRVLSPLEARHQAQAKSEYAVWQAAMELLKNHFKRTADILNDAAGNRPLFGFKEFGVVEFEKFVELQNGRFVKRPWFFTVNVRGAVVDLRYLFWTGCAHADLNKELQPHGVALRVSVSNKLALFTPLDTLNDANQPRLSEIGYNARTERFFWRHRDGKIQSGRVEDAARPFFEQIAKRLV